jgi:hypothetical protein
MYIKSGQIKVKEANPPCRYPTRRPKAQLRQGGFASFTLIWPDLIYIMAVHIKLFFFGYLKPYFLKNLAPQIWNIRLTPKYFCLRILFDI